MLRPLSRYSVQWSILLFSLILASSATAAGVDQTFEMKDAEAYHARGYEAQMQGNLTQAQFLYERARAYNPNDPSLLNDLGLVYEALGQSELAEAQYLKAIESDYKCLPAYSNLGYLYKNKLEYDKALHYFETRVKYGDPLDKWTLEAQSMVDEMMRVSPTLRKKKVMADKQILENAMVLRARERVRVSTRDKEVNADIEYQRGLMFFGMHEYDAAGKAFQACLKENPGHKTAGHMLVRSQTMPSVSLALKKTQVDTKNVVLEKSRRFKDDPVNSFAVKELETDANQQAKRQAVRRVVERANAAGDARVIAKQPIIKTDDPVDVATIEYAKGLRLLQDGYPAEAVKAFDRALVFSPDDADILAARLKALGK
ncbi:MAG: tetratricopeptide repeat protein [Candidatus Omnitrophica bacterium]|nr:tetratricopeptide repeat protein [Candidatus Omnitrophota bacterium]